MSDSNRREFLIAAAGVTTAALAGCTGGDDDDDNGDDNGNGAAGGFEIEPGTTVSFLGRTQEWEGTSPDAIDGESNPTLQLEAGEEYTFEWTNDDGALHDLQIWDGSDSVVDDLITDDLNAEGETTDITFTASEEMETYICSFHQTTQVGDLVVE